MKTSGADDIYPKAAADDWQDGRPPTLKSAWTHGNTPQNPNGLPAVSRGDGHAGSIQAAKFA